MEIVVLQLFLRQSKARRLAEPPKGGDAMSANEVVIIIFTAMTFVVVLIKLMIYIADLFSKRK